jgi:hypothetical protein
MKNQNIQITAIAAFLFPIGGQETPHYEDGKNGEVDPYQRRLKPPGLHHPLYETYPEEVDIKLHRARHR